MVGIKTQVLLIVFFLLSFGCFAVVPLRKGILHDEVVVDIQYNLDDNECVFWVDKKYAQLLYSVYGGEGAFNEIKLARFLSTQCTTLFNGEEVGLQLNELQLDKGFYKIVFEFKQPNIVLTTLKTQAAIIVGADEHAKVHVSVSSLNKRVVKGFYKEKQEVTFKL